MSLIWALYRAQGSKVAKGLTYVFDEITLTRSFLLVANIQYLNRYGISGQSERCMYAGGGCLGIETDVVAEGYNVFRTLNQV